MNNLACKGICLLLNVVFLAARPAVAQDRPVIFQHGVVSDGTTWNTMAQEIQRRLHVIPLQPSLNWKAREQDQAFDLSIFVDGHSATAGNARFPVVGHSNGGIVSREYRRQGGRIDGLLTLNTPHLGAPIATNFLNGNVVATGRELFDAVALPWWYYTQNSDNWIPLVVNTYIEMMGDFLYNLDVHACAVGMCWAAANVAVPVVVQLSPVFDTYIEGLNSSENLNAEAAMFANRRGAFWSSAHPYGVYFNLLTANPSGYNYAREVMIVGYSEAFQYYRDHPDPFWAAGAWYWADGAVAMINIDMRWQELIGALRYYQMQYDPNSGVWQWYMEVIENDGFILRTSAAYPNVDNFPLGDGIVHTAVTRHPNSTDAVDQWLRSAFNVPARLPPLNVTIDGPGSVVPGTTAQFTAYSDGDAPHAYVWSVNGTPVQSGSSNMLTWQIHDNLTIGVSVSDGRGATGTASKQVVASSCGTEVIC